MTMAIADIEFLKRLLGKRVLIIHFRRHISKERNLYKVYLPKEFNEFWEQIRSKGMDIRIIVVLPVLAEESKG